MFTSYLDTGTFVTTWEVMFKFRTMDSSMFCHNLVEGSVHVPRLPSFPTPGSVQHLEGLSEFSVAVVVNYHRLSNLKQHRFILLYFWRSGVWLGFHRAKLMVRAGQHSWRL